LLEKLIQVAILTQVAAKDETPVPDLVSHQPCEADSAMANGAERSHNIDNDNKSEASIQKSQLGRTNPKPP
jgi:hypothetical protein